MSWIQNFNASIRHVRYCTLKFPMYCVHAVGLQANKKIVHRFFQYHNPKFVYWPDSLTDHDDRSIIQYKTLLISNNLSKYGYLWLKEFVSFPNHLSLYELSEVTNFPQQLHCFMSLRRVYFLDHIPILIYPLIHE